MSYSDPTHRLLDAIRGELARIADALEKANMPPEPVLKLAEPKPKGTPKQRHEYEPEFEELWKAYPARNGSNPKWKAQQCWRARIKEARAKDRLLARDEMDKMLHGAKRYAAWCEATGKTGTEMVMQATRFLGTSREFLNTWAIPAPEPEVIKLPRDNDELVKFAAERGIETRPGENWWDFRRRVEDAI